MTATILQFRKVPRRRRKTTAERERKKANDKIVASLRSEKYGK